MKLLYLLLGLSLMSLGLLCERDILIDPEAEDKITFRMDSLDKAGLEEGDPVSYSFCIPAGAAYSREVKKIDPTLVCYMASEGPKGCGADTYICTGNTYQQGYDDKLRKLAGLDYIERIDRLETGE